ncbi:MAG TPA: hypothetical protein DCR77_02685, partial [Flavobacteriaceae bacterium]|nr:hypothetical protein [Flavobacteriaceae bacterium]
SENGKIYKSNLNKDFKATETKLFATAPQMKGPDGMIFSKEYNSFFVADYMNNAVHQISKTGKVTTLQLNGDTDGTDGKLTQPCEVALRGSELIIVNMNIDAKIATPYTLSKIDLKPL